MLTNVFSFVWDVSELARNFDVLNVAAETMPGAALPTPLTIRDQIRYPYTELGVPFEQDSSNVEVMPMRRQRRSNFF